MAQEPNIPDFVGMTEKLLQELPQQVAERARAFFIGSFIKEGFTDRAFIPWPKRKDDASHKILTRSSALRASIKIAEITDDYVKLTAGEGLPYANIHNTGGTISVPVTAKSRKFFWYMHKKTGDQKWKWMALTKKERLSIYIPQRQFIGDSQTLLKQLNAFWIKQFDNIKNL